MNKSANMTFIEILQKKLSRKYAQIKEIESIGENMLSAVDKRKYIELKATIQELENVIDLAESMLVDSPQ